MIYVSPMKCRAKHDSNSRKRNRIIQRERTKNEQQLKKKHLRSTNVSAKCLSVGIHHVKCFCSFGQQQTVFS